MILWRPALILHMGICVMCVPVGVRDGESTVLVKVFDRAMFGVESDLELSQTVH